jgi:hypothetical protein
VEIDKHILGLLPTAVWPDLLREAGLVVHEDAWQPGAVKTYIGVRPTL